MDLARRVANRWLRGQEDEPHDPTDGVLFRWQLDSLMNEAAWKGYWYRLSTWTWNAGEYEDQDEPDDWGDPKKHGPVMTLEDVLEVMLRSPFKWEEWIDEGSFQSRVKKTRKVVTQGIAQIERVDGKPLSYVERKHIGKKLGLR